MDVSMKKKSFLRLWLFGVPMMFAVAVMAETLVVKVKKTNLRMEPVFYAGTVTVLSNGAQVEKLDAKQGWYRIRTRDGQEGWLHSSAVRVKKFSLLETDRPVKSEASADEVALAGKGFNQQVEEKYQTDNPEVSFAGVDNMLTLKVTPEQLKDFLEKGKLGQFGGER
jgi:uncharacterized protein YgiM (DUF1202 family)